MSLAVAVVWTSIACGGPRATQTTTPSPAPAESATPTPRSTGMPTSTGTTTPTGTSSATPTSTAEDAGADAGGSGAIADSSEWLDKCQQNGKEFEKKVHSDLKQCHADGSKKGYLRGAIKIGFRIDWDGMKKEIKTTEKSDLPKPVVDCMLKAVKDAQFGDPEACKGKDLTIILKFPPTK
jgi:hypothetical protein